MRLSKAILVRKATKDGTIEVKDEVPLGKIYEVDLDSICVGEWFQIKNGQLVRSKRAAIITYENGRASGRMPLELFDLGNN
jgi:hypothetical protein